MLQIDVPKRTVVCLLAFFGGGYVTWLAIETAMTQSHFVWGDVISRFSLCWCTSIIFGAAVGMFLRRDKVGRAVAAISYSFFPGNFLLFMFAGMIQKASFYTDALLLVFVVATTMTTTLFLVFLPSVVCSSALELDKNADVPLISPKRRLLVALLCVFLGFLGIHRIYVEKYPSGVIQMFSLGGLGVWAIFDLALILSGRFTDAKGSPVSQWL